MKHGEHLAPLIDAVHGPTAGIVRQDLTAIAVGRRARSRSPACASGSSPPAPSASSSRSRSTASAPSTRSRSRSSAAGPRHDSFLVATDARRKEVYLASYDAEGRRLEGPVVTRPAEVATDAPVAGAGPELYPDAFPHPIAPARPSAGWLARASWRRSSPNCSTPSPSTCAAPTRSPAHPGSPSRDPSRHPRRPAGARVPSSRSCSAPTRGARSSSARRSTAPVAASSSPTTSPATP